MNFSEQFLEIINFLTSKIGIAIDWTSNNIMPYLQDICNRFIKYETINSIIWIIIMIIIGISSFLLLIKIMKIPKKRYDYYTYDEFSRELFYLMCGLGLFASLFVICIQIFYIAKLNYIPEEIIIKELFKIKNSLGY